MLRLLPKTLIELSLDNITGQFAQYYYLLLFVNNLLPALSRLENLQKLSLKQNAMNNDYISRMIEVAKLLNIA